MDTKELFSLHWDHVQSRGYTLFGTYAISYINYSCPSYEQRCDLYFYGLMIRYSDVEYLKWTVKHNAKYSELESLAKTHFETVLEHNLRCFKDNVSGIKKRDDVAEEIADDIYSIMDMIDSSSDRNRNDFENILQKRQAELERLGLPRIKRAEQN